MTTEHSSEDRRSNLRLDGVRIAVAVRPRGRLGSISAEAVDFSRHGIAIHTEQPLDKDRIIYLSLCCEGMRLDNLVGVVHNCVRQGGQYRSGIRFRPSSELQQDRLEVEAILAILENQLFDTQEASA
ncbi:MAG: PilZ domain-containing protein [Pseudomonadales bacterium]